MNKPIKPNIIIPENFAQNGVKTDFDNEKLLNGFDNLQPDVLAGDNLNKFIDDTYKGLNYSIAGTDAINLIKEGETLTVVNGELVSGNIGGGAYVGMTVFSLDPLVEDGLHLLDGTELKVGGIYDQFINTYIANLYKNAPQRFCTEAEWQASVEQYGVCGKYVYNAGVSVRLPKVTGHIEGTLDPNALGDLVEAGLPNITGSAGSATNLVSGAFYTNTTVAGGNFNGTTTGSAYLDASRLSSIYGNSDTVQTQSILGYMYIVVATGTKTDIEVDIDNVVTDLNNKVDISNMVEVPTIIEVSDPSLMPSWYIVYSNGWCEQGGQTSTWNTTINFLKPYKDTNYCLYNVEFTIANVGAQKATKSTNGFTTSSELKDSYTQGWRACGYIK